MQRWGDGSRTNGGRMKNWVYRENYRCIGSVGIMGGDEDWVYSLCYCYYALSQKSRAATGAYFPNTSGSQDNKRITSLGVNIFFFLQKITIWGRIMWFFPHFRFKSINFSWIAKVIDQFRFVCCCLALWRTHSDALCRKDLLSSCRLFSCSSSACC